MIKMLSVFLLATSLFISHFAQAEEEAVQPTIPQPEATAPTAHRDAIKSMMPYIQENASIRKEAAKKYGPAKSKKSKKKKSKKNKTS